MEGQPPTTVSSFAGLSPQAAGFQPRDPPSHPDCIPRGRTPLREGCWGSTGPGALLCDLRWPPLSLGLYPPLAKGPGPKSTLKAPLSLQKLWSLPKCLLGPCRTGTCHRNLSGRDENTLCKRKLCLPEPRAHSGTPASSCFLSPQRRETQGSQGGCFPPVQASVQGGLISPD